MTKELAQDGEITERDKVILQRTRPAAAQLLPTIFPLVLLSSRFWERPLSSLWLSSRCLNLSVPTCYVSGSILKNAVTQRKEHKA